MSLFIQLAMTSVWIWYMRKFSLWLRNFCRFLYFGLYYNTSRNTWLARWTNVLLFTWWLKIFFLIKLNFGEENLRNIFFPSLMTQIEEQKWYFLTVMFCPLLRNIYPNCTYYHLDKFQLVVVRIFLFVCIHSFFISIAIT